ncbi:MAG: hypothetical protein J0I12_24110 [Candidatus Eremiobacteraeota bacterium]|mgnify:CR=1 FL=1|nr:hypothetical protein [Candidatus Eremiobacteraeota bacterium]
MEPAQQYVLRCQEIADGLPPETVLAGTLQSFLESGRDGDLVALQQLEQDLLQLDAQYSDLHFAPSEVSAETVAAHEVITSALDLWLWCLEQALGEHPDWDELTEQAEKAQRLLLSVSVWQDELLRDYPEPGGMPGMRWSP